MYSFKFSITIIIFNLTLFVVKANSFCIEGIKNSNNNLQCDITGKIVSENEKETLKKICDKKPKFFNDTQIITLKNGTFKSFKRLSCSSNLTNIELVWLSYDDEQNNFLTNINNHYEIIAKSTNDSLSDTTICSFTTKHKNCGIEFQNESTVIISHFNLLVELLPIQLTISNITYKPWKNITSSGYPIPMSGKIYLLNHQSTFQKLFDTIKYSYFEKISVNLSKILPTSDENNLEIPGKINYNGNLIDIENDGSAYAHKSKEFTFSRTLPPFSGENATLIGEWSTFIVEFSAIIIYDYGSGHINRPFVPIDNIKMVVKTITNIDIEFEGPSSLNYSTSPLHKTQFQKNYNEIKDEKSHVKKTTITHNADKIEVNEPNSSGHVYPNFYPWFVGSCILIALTCCIVFGNMINIVIKEKNLKRRRYRTGSLM
ncbi:uncharacterized protein LOC129611607 [Condylostylus longicornis]|uniref:uncharacterized protein LOC129611607 n=1 Tax=Condylostylus longicornis TaxID=2530218 RepID=UPI00244DFF04|nr:uncharacterized protein LOC129611607 [Condylostylus longicornis]